MIDLKFGGSFCALPWVLNYKGIKKSAFCCRAVPFKEGDDINDLRNKMWNGVKIPHCTSCYSLEENNTVSPRQTESISWIKKSGDLFNTDICPIPKIAFYDFRLDNKCNLSCISCDEENSSLWAKELGIPIIPIEQNFNYEEIGKAKKIYLAGGEPLIIERYLNLIDFLSENNVEVELVINTNLTNLPEKTLNSLNKIKKTNITISIDSFEKVNEYHRYPLKWSKFINNLDRINDSNCSIRFNTVVDAVSIFGFNKIKNLEKYKISEWDLTILRNPTSLLLENIPLRLKNNAIDNAEKLKEIKFFNTDISFKTKINDIVKQIKKDGDPQLLSNFIKQLDSRRNINHEDYLGVKLT